MSVPWGRRWVCPEVNKFEQVYSDDHQMSVAGEGESTQVPYKRGTLPRDLSNDAFDVTPPPVNIQTPVKT